MNASALPHAKDTGGFQSRSVSSSKSLKDRSVQWVPPALGVGVGAGEAASAISGTVVFRNLGERKGSRQEGEGLGAQLILSRKCRRELRQ